MLFDKEKFLPVDRENLYIPSNKLKIEELLRICFGLDKFK